MIAMAHPYPDLYLDDTSVSDASLGSLFDPWNPGTPIGQANARVAACYGVERSVIGTNGTTASNTIAMLALVGPGDQVLIERDCHVSMLQSLNLIGARPIWLCPPYDPGLGVNLASTPDLIEQALQRHPQVAAVVLTSPKYHGIVEDLRAIVAACHARGIPLLVDEAHGAHLVFHPAMPISATTAGADLVTQSTHKVTEALSQGSVLHINNRSLCQRVLQVIHGIPAFSTSFHYGIVASVEDAILNMQRYGHQRLEGALRLARLLRARVADIPGLATWGAEQAGRPGFRQLDPLRVTLDVSATGLTGLAVEAALQQPSEDLPAVVAELGDTRNLLLLINFGNSEREVEILTERLCRIMDKAPGCPLYGACTVPPQALPEQVLTPRQAFWATLLGRTERVPVAQAVGRVSAESIAVYPPGNCLVVHGEVVNEEAVAYLSHMASLGAYLKGASDPQFNSLSVITPQGEERHDHAN